MTMLSKTQIVYFFNILTLISTISSDSFRLPTHFNPKHYTLKILTTLGEENRYTGSVEIVTECVNATKKITLHRSTRTKINKIEIRKTISHDSPDKYDNVELNDILYRPREELMSIFTENEMEERKEYVVYIEFEGDIVDSTYGFVKITSDDANFGDFAFTNFEPQGARQVFPCFDEPNMKTTFQIIIGRNENYKSISNMPLVKSEPVEEKSGWYWDFFMHSDTISTYLVSFMVYDNNFVWIGKENARIHVLVRKDMRAEFDMVAQTAPKLLISTEKYFGTTFPFPKLDFVAIPKINGAQSFSIISNPGLVIFNENLLIYDPANMRQEKIQNIVFNVAHTIANQFISILSIDWWSDYWIKYSLELYTTQLILDRMSGGQSLEKNDADDILTFLNNAETSPPPLEISADFNAVQIELNRLKNDVKYKLILRMVLIMLEKDDIKGIVKKFLKRNAFQTVNQEKLLEIFENSIGDEFVRASLKNVFFSWKNQSGYPLINVTRDYTKNSANITQIGFFNNENCWFIPLSYKKQSENFENSLIRDLMECPKDTLVINDIKSTDWILLNYQFGSVYRVDYDIKNWRFLSKQLHHQEKHKIIPTLNRMSLIEDIFEFTNIGEITYDFLFEFLNYAKFEQNYSPWLAIFKNAFILHWKISSNSESVKLLNEYMQKLLKTQFLQQKLEITENNLLNSLRRRIIIDTSCFFKLKNCQDEVNRYFQNFTSKSSENSGLISAEIRDIVYCYAVQNGGQENFEFLLKEYKNTENLYERDNILSGLFCSKDTEALERISQVMREKRDVKIGHKIRYKDNEHRSNKIEDIKDRKKRQESETTTETIQDTTLEDSAETTETEFSSPLDEITQEFSSTQYSPTEPEITTPIIQKVSYNFENELDFETIFLRSQFHIADSIFYSQIEKINPNKAPYYITLFTERIRDTKDFDKYKLFVQDRPKVSERILKFMEGRIEKIQENLDTQRENADNVQKALRKYFKVYQKSEALMITEKKMLIFLSSFFIVKMFL